MRVDQDVEAGDLDQNGRMADEDDPEPADPCRRLVPERARVVLRPVLPAAAELPTQELGEPFVLRPAGVEEAHAVEMVARRALVIDVARPGGADPGGGSEGRGGREAEEGQDPAAVHGGVSFMAG
jgi:hypothetical protein